VKITDLIPLKRNTFRVRIEGLEDITVSAKAVELCNLKAGADLSGSDIEELLYRDSFFRAVEYADILLAQRMRSSKELADRLKAKGFNGQVAEDVIRKFSDEGFINDAEFARWWISSRNNSRPKGKAALIAELREKGIPSETISGVLEEFEDFDEIEMAWKACGSILNSYRNLDKMTAVRRLTAFLKRRGFSWDAVNSVVGEFLNGGD